MNQKPTLAATTRYIARHARQTPDRLAVFENGRQISYLTLARDLIDCARALEARGIRPNMLVGVEHPGRYAHLLLLLACEVIGAATTSLSAAGQDNALLRQCDALLACGAPAPGLRAKAIAMPREFPPELPESPVRDQDMAELHRPVVADAIARVVTTSGSSGAPKAIALSFENQQLRIRKILDELPPGLPSRPTLLCLHPPVIGLVHRRVLGTLQLGATVLFARGPDANALIAGGAAHYAMFAVSDLETVLRDAQPPPPGHPLHVWLFGAAVAPALRRLARERLGASVENWYSSNEANLIARTDDDNVGTLGPGVSVSIVDETGVEKPPGEPGIIRVRTPTMARSYFNDPARTAAAFIDGWYQTDDIGFMPAPGKLVVLGRADEMLNIGGIKVAPAPIETRVKQIDNVRDALVMYVANRDGVGRLVVAIETDADPVPEPMRDRIGAAIAGYFVGPFMIVASPAFTRTVSGKIMRQEVEAACGEHHSGG